MTRFARLLLIAGLALALAACSQTNQTLRLSPNPPETGPRIGDGASVGFQVLDTRNDRDLGVLENPDGSIVQLVAEQDVAYAVQLAAAQALRGYDFDPGVWDAGRAPRLEIRITALEHEVIAGVPYELETEIALQATAWVQGDRYTTRARATASDQRALPPRASANTEAIEKAITRALTQLLDAPLAEFLAGNR
ncbi:MAG: YajG family lipoprotein [Spiribacter sp.]|nr:YajG family lipoprotein [Spiribacter sp.]MDR9455330.1 YajG family lipoprotein [Spiribacter sp.]